MSTTTEHFSTRIIPFLNLLGDFDPAKIRALEAKLITKLEKHGTTESRYRRFKTDKQRKVTLYHLEAEVLFRFFRDEFDEKIKDADDETKEVLEKSAPDCALDIYYSPALSK